jgi:hypothetical protein
MQWPEETYTETNIDLSNTTQNIQQKHGDLNNSFFMITMYMYYLIEEVDLTDPYFSPNVPDTSSIVDIIFVNFCLDLFIE